MRGRSFARVLSCCAVSIMACGDDASNAPRDSGADASADASRSEDAYVPMLDAAADSGRKPPQQGMDASTIGGGGVGSTIPPDAGPSPAEWTCSASRWGDAICDCGCGVRDFDCTQNSCTSLACVAVGCEVCYTETNAYKQCAPAPAPSAWKCAAAKQLDDVCDCGCGASDPACRGSGCSEPGCAREVCGRRHDASGEELTGARPPLNGWRCAQQSWGGGDGCDCGCGAPDPDCDPGLAQCTAPLCNANECRTCHDKTGRVVPCSDAIGSFTCDPQRYGAGDGCDCGCGVPDPDCGVSGCSELGCRSEACARCTDENSGPSVLVGCTPASGWICDKSHYGTGDGCDCGCGVHDPDCGDTTAGCTDKNCQQVACDYCHGAPGLDPDDDYVLCDPPGSDPGWTCGSASDPAWSGDECDCGCGKPDPDCRKAERVGCSEPGCKTQACQYCNATDQARAACTGIVWADNASCAIRHYGRDGLCDCGCGAADPDCAEDQGCALPMCAASGCDVCHGSSQNLISCMRWHCPPSAYGDGERCDCGCGAPDPDCSLLGCIEPGCSDPACSDDGCHDPFGRTVACP